MALHSSALAWRIPGTEEPGGLPSMGSHRCAGKAGNPFQTTQGNRLSCRDQEGRRSLTNTCQPLDELKVESEKVGLGSTFRKT